MRTISELKHIFYIKIPIKRPILLGSSWSRNWCSFSPWTFNGEKRPYFGVTREYPESEYLWLFLWLGPWVMFYFRALKD